MEKKNYVLASSEGTIEVDEFGNVICLYIIDEDENDGFLSSIEKVNVSEYVQWIKSLGEEPDTHEDIVLFGAWLKDGTYEEPNSLARQEREEFLIGLSAENKLYYVVEKELQSAGEVEETTGWKTIDGYVINRETLVKWFTIVVESSKDTEEIIAEWLEERNIVSDDFNFIRL